MLQTRQELETTQSQKEHAAQVRIALDDVYATRFDGKVLRPTQATTREILDMCAQYHGVDASVVVPSAQTMLEVFRLQRQAFKEAFGSLLISVQEARQEVVQDILISLRCSRPSITDFELNQERVKIQQGFTLQQLRNRLTYLLNAQRLARKSTPEIKEEIANTRAAGQPLPEQLPAEYTREVLRDKLRSMSRSETERFLQKWGLQKINNRLQGRDSSQGAAQ